MFSSLTSTRIAERVPHGDRGSPASIARGRDPVWQGGDRAEDSRRRLRTPRLDLPARGHLASSRPRCSNILGDPFHGALPPPWRTSWRRRRDRARLGRSRDERDSCCAWPTSSKWTPATSSPRSRGGRGVEGKEFAPGCPHSAYLKFVVAQAELAGALFPPVEPLVRQGKEQIRRSSSCARCSTTARAPTSGRATRAICGAARQAGLPKEQSDEAALKLELPTASACRRRARGALTRCSRSRKAPGRSTLTTGPAQGSRRPRRVAGGCGRQAVGPAPLRRSCCARETPRPCGAGVGLPRGRTPPRLISRMRGHSAARFLTPQRERDHERGPPTPAR
jgi:hypothetical protein